MNPRGLQETEYHGSVGAGFEGWMKGASSSLLVAMSKQLLAMAKPRAVMILRCRTREDGARASSWPIITISLPHSEESHNIEAIQWLVFNNWSVLALGTSQGSVLFYSTRGSLLLRQVFYCSPVLQLRVRGDNSRVSHKSCMEELSVVYSKAIVRIDTTDLQLVLQRCLNDVEVQRRRGRFSAVTDIYYGAHKVVHQVWNISRNTGGASCVDGVVSGVIALPLFECQQPKQRHFCAITVGPSYVFAAHRLIDDGSSSIVSIIMNKIVPTAWSTFATLSRIFWQDNSEQQPMEAKPQEFSKGEQLATANLKQVRITVRFNISAQACIFDRGTIYVPASLVTALKDGPRKGEKIALSPGGSLAALTDSLGRILLVDTQTLVVIRLWKGYRDARCFFIDVPADDTSLASTSSRSARRSGSKHGFYLCLAIYVPRRGVVEIWKLCNGPRLSIIKCGQGFHVIQPAIPLHGSEANTGRDYVPAELYILNGFSGDVAAIRLHASSHRYNLANHSIKETLITCLSENVA